MDTVKPGKPLRDLREFMPPGDARILTMKLQAQILAGICANRRIRRSWNDVEKAVHLSRSLLLQLMADNHLHPLTEDDEV